MMDLTLLARSSTSSANSGRSITSLSQRTPRSNTQSNKNEISVELIRNITECYDLSRIDTLCLSGLIVPTRITRITSLNKLVNLVELDLSENQIKKIENLGSLVNLKTLLLHHNRIAEYENLSSLEKLEHLDLSDNLISYIPVACRDNPLLERLNLANNNIAKKESIYNLRLCEKLQVLIMEGNTISQQMDYKAIICEMLPKLVSLDAEDICLTVSPNEKEDANKQLQTELCNNSSAKNSPVNLSRVIKDSPLTENLGQYLNMDEVPLEHFSSESRLAQSLSRTKVKPFELPLQKSNGNAYSKMTHHKRLIDRESFGANWEVLSTNRAEKSAFSSKIDENSVFQDLIFAPSTSRNDYFTNQMNFQHREEGTNWISEFQATQEKTPLANEIEKERGSDQNLSLQQKEILKKLEEFQLFFEKDNELLLELQHKLNTMLEANITHSMQLGFGTSESSWIIKAQALTIESLINQKQELQKQLQLALDLRSLVEKSFNKHNELGYVNASTQTIEENVQNTDSFLHENNDTIILHEQIASQPEGGACSPRFYTEKKTTEANREVENEDKTISQTSKDADSHSPKCIEQISLACKFQEVNDFPNDPVDAVALPDTKTQTRSPQICLEGHFVDKPPKSARFLQKLLAQNAIMRRQQNDSSHLLSKRHHEDSQHSPCSSSLSQVIRTSTPIQSQSSNSLLYRKQISNLSEKIAQQITTQNQKNPASKLLNVYKNINNYTKVRQSNDTKRTNRTNRTNRTESPGLGSTSGMSKENSQLNITNSSEKENIPMNISVSQVSDSGTVSQKCLRKNNNTNPATSLGLNLQQVFRKPMNYQPGLERPVSPSFQNLMKKSRMMLRSPDITKFSAKFDICSPHHPINSSSPLYSQRTDFSSKML